MSQGVRQGTVCFLIKSGKVLLALLEYGPNDRKWNGLGGVVDASETPAETVLREIEEETQLRVDKSSLKAAKILSLPDLELHIFIAIGWSGEETIKDPTIKELRWFDFAKVPYGQMWEGNDKWLPQVLLRYNEDMNQELESTAKKVGDQIIDLSASLDTKMEKWSDVSKRPDNLSNTECAGFINKETDSDGLNLVVDVQAPANGNRATLRLWAIESKTDNEVERFNNIQLTFEMEYNHARSLAQKANQITLDDIRTALHEQSTRLTHVTVSDQSGVDEKSQQKLGERYDLDVSELEKNEGLIPRVTDSLNHVISGLKQSAAA